MKLTRDEAVELALALLEASVSGEEVEHKHGDVAFAIGTALPSIAQT